MLQGHTVDRDQELDSIPREGSVHKPHAPGYVGGLVYGGHQSNVQEETAVRGLRLEL